MVVPTAYMKLWVSVSWQSFADNVLRITRAWEVRTWPKHRDTRQDCRCFPTGNDMKRPITHHSNLQSPARDSPCSGSYLWRSASQCRYGGEDWRRCVLPLSSPQPYSGGFEGGRCCTCATCVRDSSYQICCNWNQQYLMIDCSWDMANLKLLYVIYWYLLYPISPWPSWKPARYSCCFFCLNVRNVRTPTAPAIIGRLWTRWCAPEVSRIKRKRWRRTDKIVIAGFSERCWKNWELWNPLKSYYAYYDLNCLMSLLGARRLDGRVFLWSRGYHGWCFMCSCQ